MTTAEKIKFQRENAGFTQEALASLVGVDRVTITKYENGSINPPTKRLEKIAEALGCSFVDLYGYEVDEKKKTVTVSSSKDSLHVQMAFREKARIKHETYKAITKCYEKLNTDGQKLLLGCAELLSASPSLIDNEPPETVIINDHTNETKNEADQEYGRKTEEGQERTSQDQ